MTDKDSKSLDILGIKPIGDAINTTVEGSIQGTAAFLSRICLPAAEEFGLLLRDRVSYWRSAQLAKIVEKAERKKQANSEFATGQAHPRLVASVVQNSSWINDDEVQEMWAGLLVSSCTKNGDDESNLIFIKLLSQLTSLQVKILNFVCENVEKHMGRSGLIYADGLLFRTSTLISKFGVDDLHRLDRELDHLRSLELILGGFPGEGGVGIMFYSYPPCLVVEEGDKSTWQMDPTALDGHYARIMPTALALNLYVRGQGSRSSPVEYFNLPPTTPEDPIESNQEDTKEK